MIHDFDIENLDSITEVLGVKPKVTGKVRRFEVKSENKENRLALEILHGLEFEDTQTNIVSVYAHNVFLQLHNCTRFIASKTLQQITFFGKIGGQTTGLIVGKDGSCSLYANVNDELLNGDFTKLPPEIMMCSVALSLTEAIDFEGFTFDDES